VGGVVEIALAFFVDLWYNGRHKKPSFKGSLQGRALSFVRLPVDISTLQRILL
jgi:hypothetical protein